MNKDKWIKYEKFKRELREKNLSPEDYEEAIKLYCKVNNL